MFNKRKLSIHRLPLSIALIISIILAIAAWGKFFYPTESLKTLDYCISGFEVLLLLSLIFLHRYWRLWALAGAVFAAWGGYAFYWHVLQLPCSCMGQMIKPPTIFSIFLDIIFWILSFSMILHLSPPSWLKRHWIYFYILVSLFAGLIGYAFAEFVYTKMLLKPK